MAVRAPGMAGRIFINYRRDDSFGTAGRLHDRLARSFGRKNLFMDVDHIPAGVDFVDHLNTQVAKCAIFLAIIGRNWLDAKDDSGRRRIDNPDDFVTAEIAAALARQIRVIPVMVDGAQMPKAGELPEYLQPIVRRNFVEIRNAHFGRDVGALAEEIREALKDVRAGPSRWPVATASLVAMVLVSWIGLYQMGAPVWMPWTLGAVQPVAGVPDTSKTDADARRIANAEPKVPTKAGQPSPPSVQPSSAPVQAPSKPLQLHASSSVLSPEREQALKPKDSFKECDACPEMVVVPAGSFTMGSDEALAFRPQERPLHRVNVTEPLAVSKYAVTFDEWDACVSGGGCNEYSPGDEGFDRGKRPVINVSWVDAKRYVAWLTEMTGKPYRLLSEAEREYVARGVTSGTEKNTQFWWGDGSGFNQANCADCGSQWDKKQTAPVGSFAANPFGLYDVHGNVWEWVEDCWHDNYEGAPRNSVAWTSGSCDWRVLRGGAWAFVWTYSRSAGRFKARPTVRAKTYGLRVARTLSP